MGLRGHILAVLSPLIRSEAGIITTVGAAIRPASGQQISGFLQFTFWLPFFFLGLVIGSPDSPVLVVLSLFHDFTYHYRPTLGRHRYSLVAIVVAWLPRCGSCSRHADGGTARLPAVRYGHEAGRLGGLSARGGVSR